MASLMESNLSLIYRSKYYGDVQKKGFDAVTVNFRK